MFAAMENPRPTIQMVLQRKNSPANPAPYPAGKNQPARKGGLSFENARIRFQLSPTGGRLEEGGRPVAQLEKPVRKSVAGERAAGQNPIQCCGAGVVQRYQEQQIATPNASDPMIAAGADAAVYRNWMALSGGMGNALITLLNRFRIPALATPGSGISTGSCNAIAEYCLMSHQGSQFFYAAGNSYAQRATVHAERQAIENVINYVNPIEWAANDRQADPGNITRIYVEMSPCPVCHGMLPGLVPNATVLYSVDYTSPSERKDLTDWKKKQSKGPDGGFGKIPHESGQSSYFPQFFDIGQ